MSEELQPGEIRAAVISGHQRWWHHPFWVISGWLLGLAGFVAGFFFFFTTREVKELTYSIPERLTIYDSSVPSRIRVTNAQGEAIEGNVYLQEFVIWNSGNLPIEPEDVRLPVRIVMSLESCPSCEILEFGITNQVDPRISRFGVQQPSCCDNELHIEWDHFDPENGVRMQVIYQQLQGNQAEFSLEGSILGIRQFIDGDLDVSQRFLPWLPIWLVLVLTFIPMMWLAHLLTQWALARFSDLMYLAFGVVLVCVFVGIALLLVSFLSSSSAPPV